MKNNLSILVVMALATISTVLACTKTETGGAFDFGDIFELNYEADKTSSDGSVMVLFNKDVIDSRCPLNVICFWEGQAEVTLTVTFGDTEPQDVFLILRANYEELAKDTLNNYIFTLTDVLPYPEESEVIDQKDYALKLKIEEL